MENEDFVSEATRISTGKSTISAAQLTPQRVYRNTISLMDFLIFSLISLYVNLFVLNISILWIVLVTILTLFSYIRIKDGEGSLYMVYIFIFCFEGLVPFLFGLLFTYFDIPTIIGPFSGAILVMIIAYFLLDTKGYIG